MTTQPAVSAQPYTVQRYVADVAAIMDRNLPLEEAVKEIANAKRRFVNGGAPLPPELLKQHPIAPYTRNLVHRDPKDRFTVIALVWGAFQDTAVHDHFNWCVVGVVSGCAHVVNYERLDDGSTPGKADLRVSSSTLQPAGAVAALLPPPRTNIHKMCNGGRGVMVSLHTYGDPGDKATAYNIKEGSYASIDLRFHNLEP
ncbi:MAG TPA: cysteine dioxygenase family protein [Planctomycetota bacterium]|nr:cysteine dioxygenase family protein [Planctomycetota bacterium]